MIPDGKAAANKGADSNEIPNISKMTCLGKEVIVTQGDKVSCPKWLDSKHVLYHMTVPAHEADK
jgi:hypothetical protein